MTNLVLLIQRCYLYHQNWHPLYYPIFQLCDILASYDGKASNPRHDLNKLQNIRYKFTATNQAHNSQKNILKNIIGIFQKLLSYVKS